MWQVKGTGGWTFNAGGYRPNVFDGPAVSGFHSYREGARVHQTQKPLWLMRALLELHTAPGDLILDPYAGSGTTLVAAKFLGRRAVGIEQDQVHCAQAVKRLQQGVLDFDGTQI